MIDKKTVDKIIKKAVHTKEPSLAKPRMINPKREWAIGLSVGILLIVLGGWWNVYTYERFSGAVAYDSEVSENVVVYRESVIESALSDFDERALKYESLRKELSGMRPESPASTTENISTVEMEEGNDAGIDIKEEVNDEGDTEEVAEENNVNTNENEEVLDDGSDLSESEAETQNVQGSESENDVSSADNNTENETAENRESSPEDDQGVPESAF